MEHLNQLDTRYNTPKQEPKATALQVNKTVVETEIYRRARLAIMESRINDSAQDVILLAQDRQVAYGIDKYPEPLNPNTWSVIETIDHAIDESIDRLHYFIMLRIKLEQRMATSYDNTSTLKHMKSVANMIGRSIDDLYCLALLRIEEAEKIPVGNNDSVKNNAPKSGYVGYNIDDILATKQAGYTYTGETLQKFTDDELAELAKKVGEEAVRTHARRKVTF
jgi:hypothetical protein